LQSMEGTEDWWVTSCSRERRDWSCDSRVGRRMANLDLTIRGLQRQLTLIFDDNTAAATAKDLTVRAFRLFDDEDSPRRRCSSNPDIGNVENIDADWSEVRAS